MLARAAASRRGSATLLGVIVILVLLGIIGLAIDTALVMTANQQLQRAADSIALSAANQFQYTQAANWPRVRAKALETAAEQRVIGRGTSGVQIADNPTNAVARSGRTDMLIGRWGFNRTSNVFEFVRTDFGTGLPAPNAVQIYPRFGDGTSNSALSLIFSPVFGATSTSDVGRPATAVLGRPDSPLILVLDPTSTSSGALHLNGGVTIDVEAGTVHVDSSNGCAFDTSGSSAVLSAQRTRIVGGACINASNLTGDLITGSYYVPDPLAGLATPSTSGMPNNNRIRTGGNYGPGYYPGGIRLNGGNANLAAGVYYVEGGIDLGGNSMLNGTGVCLYLATGAFTTNGNAGVTLTPPSSGTYAGISYFQGRSNTTASSILGGGAFAIEGTIYFPNATFGMGGNASRTIGRIVVWRLDISGNAGYVITGLGLPPPSGPLHVYLVK